MLEFDIFNDASNQEDSSPAKTETKKEGGLPHPPEKCHSGKFGLPSPPVKKSNEPTPVQKSSGQDDIFDFIGSGGNSSQGNNSNIQNQNNSPTHPKSQFGQNNQQQFTMDLLGGSTDMNMNMNNQNQAPQIDFMGGQNMGMQPMSL